MGENSIRILAIHSNLGKDQNIWSAVDTWRIARPMKYLQENMPEWTIDEQLTPIPGLEKYKNSSEFKDEEMDKAFKVISSYDIIFSSYHADPTGYTMYKVAADKTGTQFIMDVDDDMFAINPDNPFWLKMDDEKAYWMQCMIRDNTWLSTTTEDLAKVFRDRRPNHPANSVFVNHNYLTDDYKHNTFDNGDRIVIGFFGGASHYQDLNETGMAEGLEKLMHENKSVYFRSIGMPMDKYLPRARYSLDQGKRGDGWMRELYPNMNYDISVAPLHDNIFNQGKSNIKWQESTRAGAAFVASNIGPYKHLKAGTALLVDHNTPEDWYKALKQVVDDQQLRKRMVKAAQAELKAHWRLENHWQQYKRMFETVYKYKQSKELARV